MKTITLHIKSESVATKILWMLDHFKDDGIEIIKKEDLKDLMLLKETRYDEVTSFDEYLQNED